MLQQCLELSRNLVATLLEVSSGKDRDELPSTTSAERDIPRGPTIDIAVERVGGPESQKLDSNSPELPEASSNGSQGKKQPSSNRAAQKLHEVVKDGNIDQTKELLRRPSINIEFPNEHGLTPLLAAVRYGHYDIAELLLQHKANVHAVDNDKRTVLHHAMLQGDRNDLISLLLKSGADINARKDDLGWTPLHCSVFHRRESAARIIINNKANLEVKDTNGTTPGMLAVKERFLEMVKVLYEGGAEFGGKLPETNQAIEHYLETAERAGT